MPKPIDKLMEGLRTLAEGYTELKAQLADKLEIDYDSIEDVKDPELSQNLYSEVRSLIENFLESEDIPSTVLGSLFSDLYEGLLEVDPQAIEDELDEEEEDDDDYYFDDEDEDFDDEDEED